MLHNPVTGHGSFCTCFLVCFREVNEIILSCAEVFADWRVIPLSFQLEQITDGFCSQSLLSNRYGLGRRLVLLAHPRKQRCVRSVESW